jgi:hypothetical protein
MANETSYKNYLLDTLAILLEKNKSLQEQAQQNKDEFLDGQLFAYYDILTILKQQAIAFGIDEKELGLAEISEADLIAAMV